MSVSTINENVRVALNRADCVHITFEKRDGTIREMIATTNPLCIPEDKQVSLKEDKPRAVNPDQVRVFDLEKQEWRSFNINSLINYVVP